MRKSFQEKISKVLRIFVLLPFFAQTFVSPILAIEEFLPEDKSLSSVDIPLDTSEDILDEGISTGPWVEDEDGATTSDVVVLGEVYTAPQNGAVSLMFTRLPEESGFLTINEITLTDEEVEATNAVSSTAYDITTDMEDGTYEYDLTLPTTSDDVSVVYAEEREDILNGVTEVNEELNVEDGVVEIEGLDHFTVFVVVNPVNPANCDAVHSNDACYDTIQEAIDNSTDEGEIYVGSSYDSSLESFPIIVDVEVKLYGSQENVDPRPSMGGRSGDETIVDGGGSQIMRIDADNVEINGFEFVDGGGYMIEQRNTHSNYVFQYNIVHDQNGDDAVKVRVCTDCSVNNNYVYDITFPGDGIGISGATNCLVDNNEVTNVSSDNAAIYVYGSTNTTISNNLIYDIPVGEGIKLGNKGGSDEYGTGGTISGNVVYDIGDPSDSGDNNDDGIAVYMSNVLVDGNEIYNDYSENGALYLAHDISNITITNNYIHDNDLETIKPGGAGGITLDEEVNASTVNINNNEIVNNTP